MLVNILYNNKLYYLLYYITNANKYQCTFVYRIMVCNTIFTLRTLLNFEIVECTTNKQINIPR